MNEGIYETVESVVNDLLNEYKGYLEQDNMNGDDPSFNQGAIEALEELLYRLSES